MQNTQNTPTSSVKIRIQPEILDVLIPEYVRMTKAVRDRFVELITEEMETVLELASELDETKICVNELRYILSLRGINICF
jgi:hypothetical protein